MSSTSNRKFGYLRERCINAYWMLKQGKFKLIVKSIFVELKHRIELAWAWMLRRNELDDSQVPGSGYVNRRKILPPSYQPTVQRLSAMDAPQFDGQAVAAELQIIVATFKNSKK